MKYYLGIDGGGSKTTALLCDENLREVSCYTGEGINYRAIGIPAARENLKKVIAGVLPDESVLPSAVFIGHSALSGKANSAQICDFCGDVIPCKKIGMDSDLYIGLEAMGTDGPAAIAICGTGSMAAGRLTDGTVIHTGGWGYLLGDEGSGFAISLDALKAAVRGTEGAGPRTALTENVLSFFQLKNTDALIDLVYAQPLPRSRIAAFAPIVFRIADDGDAQADRILRNHVCLFADTLKALLRKMPAGTPVGLWGGIFLNQPLFRDRFIKEINRDFRASKIELLPHSPEFGAVLAAKKIDPD